MWNGSEYPGVAEAGLREKLVVQLHATRELIATRNQSTSARLHEENARSQNGKDSLLSTDLKSTPLDVTSLNSVRIVAIKLPRLHEDLEQGAETRAIIIHNNVALDDLPHTQYLHDQRVGYVSLPSFIKSCSSIVITCADMDPVWQPEKVLSELMYRGHGQPTFEATFKPEDSTWDSIVAIRTFGEPVPTPTQFDHAAMTRGSYRNVPQAFANYRLTLVNFPDFYRKDRDIGKDAGLSIAVMIDPDHDASSIPIAPGYVGIPSHVKSLEECTVMLKQREPVLNAEAVVEQLLNIEDCAESNEVLSWLSLPFTLKHGSIITRMELISKGLGVVESHSERLDTTLYETGWLAREYEKEWLARKQIQDMRRLWDRWSRELRADKEVDDSHMHGLQQHFINNVQPSPMSNFSSPASFMTMSSPASLVAAANKEVDDSHMHGLQQHFINNVQPSPMSNFSSPASFMTMSSPASFMTARSTHASPAFNLISGYSPAQRIQTIQEDVALDANLSAPLKELQNDYRQLLVQQEIIQPFDAELNWSGKGQHVTFLPKEPIPLSVLSHLGSSSTAKVDSVLCRRIAVARKTMRCSRHWTIADALQEVFHLQNLRHAHIVQLVGSYLQGRNFSILMYPVADCHLGTFLEDTADLKDSSDTEAKSLLAASNLSMSFVHLPCISSSLYP